jgi:glycosyltransferase involved in cell wall biosynthesis
MGILGRSAQGADGRMKIAVFTTIAGRGGAPAAMRRLVRALTARGHQVDVFSLEESPGVSEVKTVKRLPVDPAAADIVDALEQIARREATGSSRTGISNTLFSLPLTGFRLADVGRLAAYDAINIHWVAQFLSVGALREIADLGRPMLFTLHDMAGFTGGCHYSAGCRRYAEDCADCPQLAEDVLGLPATMLAAKRGLRRFGNLAAVAPSRWMRDCAAASGVFATERCFHIDNAIETDIFCPFDKSEAKESLGLAPQCRTILLGADSNLERRKGFHLALDMLARIRAIPAMEALCREDRLQILSFGLGHLNLEGAGFPVRHLGQIGDDQAMARAYSAADVFVLPSIEDNQPNVMLEAMSCGTPVASFAVGGMRETITNGATGVLIAPYDSGAMAQALADLLDKPEKLQRLGSAARQEMANNYTLDRQASKYESLIEQMRSQAESGAQDAAAGQEPPRTLSVCLAVDRTVVGDQLLATLDPRIRFYIERRHFKQFESRDKKLHELEAGIRELERENRELHASLQEKLAEIERLKIDAHALEAIERLGEEALSDVLGSTSWRITRGLRRLFGAVDPAPAQGAAAQRGLANLGTVLSVRASTYWDLAAPLRLAQRLGRRLAAIVGRPSPD